MVEERGDSLELFAAIREAMVSVRSEAPPRPQTAQAAQRPARGTHMQRQAQKDGFQRTRWSARPHVPALDKLPAKADNDLPKALPKAKVTATWVPWSNHNLSFSSGYGAGVDCPAGTSTCGTAMPGSADRLGARAARLFREEGSTARPRTSSKP
jgi:hypothetical protein